MKRLDRKGMTIIEVLVALGIFLLLLSGIIAVMLWGLRGRDVVWEQLTTQNEGRKVVQDFINEIRRANASSVGAYPIELATINQVIFYSNIDDDSWRERVRYYLDGRTLKKGVIKPTGNPLVYDPADEVITEVVHDVTNDSDPLFYYYNENYTGETTTSMSYPVDITAIRVVGVNLLLEEKPNVSPAPFAIETKAVIRNLKTN